MEMAGIDRPSVKFSEALDIVGVIHGNKIESLENLAVKLGHKTTNSGGFNIKVASLAKYGLADRQKGKLHLTPLALKILMPVGGDKEKCEAYREAIFNVSLLKRLYERLDGQEVREDDLWGHLYEITGDREASVQQAAAVHGLYRDALTYLRKAEQVTPLKVGPHPAPRDEQARTEIENAPVTDSMIRLESGNIVLQLPRTLENISIIKSALDAMVPKEQPAPKTQSVHDRDKGKQPDREGPS